MQKYIVIVRNYNMYNPQPSDQYLVVMDGYYVSPPVVLDMEDDWSGALEAFYEKHKKHFEHFLNWTFELIPM